MSYRLLVLGCLLAAISLLGPATALAGFAGTEVFLPSVGFGEGVPPSVWYTTIWVSNLSESPANVTFYLLERNQANLAPLSYNDTIPAGDTRKYDNAIQVMFARQTFGALRITANRRIVVSSRIYSQIGPAIEDSTGQFFAGVPQSFSIGSGESTQIIGVFQTQPSDDSAFRTNFGFVETTGAGTCEVRVTVHDNTGVTLDSKNYTVRRWEQLQKTFKTEFASISTQNARLTVAVMSGSGRIVAFGSGVTNGSQDPSTLEMVFADELLAENTAGGITGVTAGNGLTGGGTSGTVTLAVGEGEGISVSSSSVSIAPGGVDKSMLAAAGGVTGQVLGTDGANLAWQAPGPVLPYYASIDLDREAAFEIGNDGDRGIAITGRSTDYAGVFGVSTDSIGVYGAGSNFIGVLGYGKSGVVGEGNGEDSFGARFINYEEGEPGLMSTGGSNAAADIILGARSSSADDGIITSDPEYATSDIGLHSMDRVWIDLDDDNNSTGSFFRIRDGVNATIFNLDEEGNLTASGTKSAAVNAGPFGRVKLYAVESPENWFEDFGSGTLVDGTTLVAIDPVYAETVNLAAGYHVFLTPLGDCPLYVAEKGTAGFVVHASGGSSCAISFDYRIVARRAGYEHLRLDKVEELEDDNDL